ncbi:MAG: hypothetical protein V1688_00765 [bacterium]
MLRQELIEYIKKQLQNRRSKEDIKSALAMSGWQAQDIEDGFKVMESNIPLPQSATQSMPPSFRSTRSGKAKEAILPGSIELLQEAWNVYQARIKTFVGIAAVPAIIMLLLLAILLIFRVVIFGIFFLGFGIIILFVIILPIIILQLWSQAALVVAVKASGESIGITESYKRSWNKIWPFFWMTILSAIIILIGFLFFIIPGIILAIQLSFAPYIALVEDQGALSSIKKSREYVKDFWWEVLWRFVFIGLIIIITQIISGLIPFAGILLLILSPIITIYFYSIYRHLKAIKE